MNFLKATISMYIFVKSIIIIFSISHLKNKKITKPMQCLLHIETAIFFLLHFGI